MKKTHFFEMVQCEKDRLVSPVDAIATIGALIAAKEVDNAGFPYKPQNRTLIFRVEQTDDEEASGLRIKKRLDRRCVRYDRQTPKNHRILLPCRFFGEFPT